MYETTTAQPVGLEVFGRRALLEESLVNNHVTLAGFAEARSHKRQIVTAQYIMHCSGGTRGQLGCEIWVARRYPIVNCNGSVKFCNLLPNHVVVFYSSSRILGVTIHLNSDYVHVVAFHAPHAGTGKLRDEFWKELDSALAGLDRANLIWLCDANALVGSVASASVGTYCAQKQNANGAAFHKLLVKYSLYVPNTFSSLTNNRSVITHAKNRIDYIAVPIPWAKFEQVAGARKLPGTLAASNDHIPTFLSVCPGDSGKLCWTSRKDRFFDIDSLRACAADPENPRSIETRDRLQAVADDLPLEVNPDISIHTACQSIATILRDIFPKKPGKFKRNKFISDNTRSLAKTRDDQIEIVKSLQGLAPFHQLCLDAVSWLKSLNKDVKKSASRDRREWISGIASNICASDKLHSDRNTYKSMRLLEKRGPKPSLQIVDEDGCPILSPLEVRKAFQTKIAKLTNGRIVTLGELLESYHSLAQHDVNDLVAATELAPSQATLEALCACTKCFSAGGEDNMPVELLHWYPKQMAAILYPIIFQIVSTLSEPLAWLGGVSHELLKSGALPTLVKSFRMILLSDVFGKIYHKYLRSLLTNNIQTYILDSMCGGFLNRGTDFATLFLAGFYDLARMIEQSWAVLFLDVASAFESLQRFFVFRSQVSDAQAATIFKKCNMPLEAWLEFQNALRDPCAFQASGVSNILDKVVACAHASTWYTFDGLDTFVLTEQGSKPGDPLGDIIFAFLIAKIIKYSKSKFKSIYPNAGNIHLPASVSIFGEHEEMDIDLFCVNYVDDNAFPVIGSSAEQVVSTVCDLAACVLDSFAGHLMHCSLAPNKTAVLLGLRGKSQRTIYTNNQYFSFNSKQLFLKSNSKCLGPLLVPIVKSYKHLGRWNSASITPCIDIAKHIGSASVKVGEMAGHILGNKEIALVPKLKFALVPVAKLLASANTWYNITEHSLQSLDFIYTRIYKLVHLGRRFDDRVSFSYSKFYSTYPTPNVLACIRGRRLRLFSRVIHSAPCSLVALLSASALYRHSFAAEIGRDLEWLFASTCFPEELGMLAPSDHCLMWRRLVVAFPNKFRKAIKAAETIDNEALPRPIEVKDAQAYACHICNVSLPDVQAYYGHMARIHHHRNPFKLRAEGTQCLACLKNYHNREKLCHHLRYSSKLCAQYYINHVPILSQDVLRREDKSTAAMTAQLKRDGLDHKFSVLPPIRHQGPLPDRAAPIV